MTCFTEQKIDFFFKLLFYGDKFFSFFWGALTGSQVVTHYEAEVWSDSSTSDSDIEVDVCGSPRVPRRKRVKQFRADRVERSTTFRTLNELFYNDNLPEVNRTHRLNGFWTRHRNGMGSVKRRKWLPEKIVVNVECIIIASRNMLILYVNIEKAYR